MERKVIRSGLIILVTSLAASCVTKYKPVPALLESIAPKWADKITHEVNKVMEKKSVCGPVFDYIVNNGYHNTSYFDISRRRSLFYIKHHWRNMHTVSYVSITEVNKSRLKTDRDDGFYLGGIEITCGKEHVEEAEKITIIVTPEKFDNNSLVKTNDNAEVVTLAALLFNPYTTTNEYSVHEQNIHLL